MSDQPPDDQNPNLPPYQPPEPGGYQVPSAPQPGGFPPGGNPSGGNPPGVPPADSFPPPGGYPPPGGGYGYEPAMASGTPYPESSQADIALGLSIGGAVLTLGACCFAPFALVGLGLFGAGAYMGHTEVNAIDAGRRNPAKRGNANAARIVGAVGAAIAVIFFVIAVLGFALSVVG